MAQIMNWLFPRYRDARARTKWLSMKLTSFLTTLGNMITESARDAEHFGRYYWRVYYPTIILYSKVIITQGYSLVNSVCQKI